MQTLSLSHTALQTLPLCSKDSAILQQTLQVCIVNTGESSILHNRVCYSTLQTLLLCTIAFAIGLKKLPFCIGDSGILHCRLCHSTLCTADSAILSLCTLPLCNNSVIVLCYCALQKLALRFIDFATLHHRLSPFCIMDSAILHYRLSRNFGIYSLLENERQSRWSSRKNQGGIANPNFPIIII